MTTPSHTGRAAGTAALVDLFGRMALIRAFEDRVSALARGGALPGVVHTSLGQEAVAVGVCAALERDDQIVSNHRGHGHCLAKGADLGAAMAELFGKATGLCGGKGGSMHLADPAAGVLGANGIVGAGLPLAVGAALTSRVRGSGRVVAAFFGDGAVDQGAYHEALNLACLWDLPVVFVCENNGFAEFSAAGTRSRRSGATDTAPAYGIPATVVDGNDVEAVHEEAVRAVQDCRAGRGPVLIEALTSRWHGHYEGDPERYRTGGGEPRRDPLALARTALEARGDATPGALDELEAAARARVDAAEAAARAAPDPRPATALEHVHGD